MPSTPANDLPASASFSARKHPPHIPANTPQIFSSLVPLICQRLLRFATKDDSTRFLGHQPTVISPTQTEYVLSAC
jgi:hypothetical protein